MVQRLRHVTVQLMKHLLRHHGLKLTGAKPDMYSVIRESSKSPRPWHMIDEMGHAELDSKHKSGVPSTVYTPIYTKFGYSADLYVLAPRSGRVKAMGEAVRC